MTPEYCTDGHLVTPYFPDEYFAAKAERVERESVALWEEGEEWDPEAAWETVGRGQKAHYWVVRHKRCGSLKEVQMGNLRRGSVKCGVCGTGRKPKLQATPKGKPLTEETVRWSADEVIAQFGWKLIGEKYEYVGRE